MKTKFLLILSIVLLVNITVHGQSANDLIGTWHNDLHSTLTITSISSTGQLTGTYSSPSGTAGQTFPIIGLVNEAPTSGKQNHALPLMFAVKWGSYGTITSWTGSLTRDSSGKLKINTIWNLVRANSDFPWDHIVTNSDTFKK